MEPCPIWNKVFSSINSLRTHKSRFHRSKKKILSNVKEKVLPTAFENSIPSRQDINRKRYRSNQDLSNDSENTEDSEEFKPKVRKIVNEESSDSSEVEKLRYKK